MKVDRLPLRSAENENEYFLFVDERKRVTGRGFTVEFITKGYNTILHGMAKLSGILIFSAFVMIVIDVLMRITGLEPFIFIMKTIEYIFLWFTMVLLS